MELQNKERLLLIGLVKKEIKRGESERTPEHVWSQGYTKPRKKYGEAKMVTLYDLEKKLRK